MSDHKRNTFWRDRSGLIRGRWLLLIFIATFAAVIIGVVMAMWAGSEVGCDQKADQLATQGVVGGDFRVWSNTCYLTFRSGKVIDADQLRVITRAR